MTYVDSVIGKAVIEQVKGRAGISLTSPVEDAHFLPSTHMAAHNTLNSSFRRSEVLHFSL